jgi:hypothetical protein
VNKQSADAAASSHLNPARLQALVVGDAAKVLPGLKELLASRAIGEGELVMLDADGQIVQGSGGK